MGMNVVFAQNTTSMSGNYLMTDSLNLEQNEPTLIKSNKKKITYGLEVGTAFSSNGGTYSYVSPFILFPVTNKFTIDVGMRMSTGSMFYGYTPYLTENNALFGNNLRQNTFYVRGRYSVNPRLVIFGTGYYQKNFLFTDSEMSNQNFDTKSMSLGFEYKISNSSTLLFEFQTGNMYNTYRNDNLFYPNNSIFPQRLSR